MHPRYCVGQQEDVLDIIHLDITKAAVTERGCCG